jgi:hypothetical protein
MPEQDWPCVELLYEGRDIVRIVRDGGIGKIRVLVGLRVATMVMARPANSI